MFNSTKTMLQPGAIALMLLIAATRFHHTGTPFALPDASLAVFFLSGLWFGGWALFAGLLVEAGLIDYVAITQFGVSDYCISPAYVFLIPTYAAMWFGGKWSAKYKTSAIKDLMPQFAALVLSTTFAFLMSNGSFNVLSGRYPEWSWGQFFDGALQYFPDYLSSTAIYVVVIVAAVKLFKLIPAAQSWHKPV
ncbi:MAG: hypothetical protein ACU83N_03825 [Gammaproteobacteria bacterium]